MLERKERLNEVYEHLHNKCGVHTKAEFADKIQYARAYVSSALNGNEKYLTDKLFRSICEKFPQFNLDYLLTGNGELLTKKEPETAPFIENRTTEFTGVLFHAGGSASVSLDDEWQPTWQGSW